jgi:hypothetical protein
MTGMGTPRSQSKIAGMKFPPENNFDFGNRQLHFYLQVGNVIMTAMSRMR